MSCKFPNCKRMAEKNGYCIGHKAFATFTPAKPAAAVNKKSDKRKEEEKEYKKLVARMMLASKKCEIRSPDCTKVAQGLHHMKGRVGDLYLDPKYLKRACNACNAYVEKHPGWARENGHSVSRLKKEPSTKN